MPTQQTIRFTADNIQLAGTLHLPDTTQPPFVIGCHGLLANRDSPKQIALAEALNAIGIAYLRFDHRGCGESQGVFDTRHLLSSRCSDLYHAIQTLQGHSGLGSPAGLFGSSFGGTVVLAVAADQPVLRLVTYAAPVDGRSIHRPSVEQIQANASITPAEHAAYNFDITDHLGAVSHILVMHGEKDAIVPLDHARKIYAAAQEPKQLIVHAGGDHRMTDPTHQRQFIEACVAWFGQVNP